MQLNALYSTQGLSLNQVSPFKTETTIIIAGANLFILFISAAASQTPCRQVQNFQTKKYVGQERYHVHKERYHVGDQLWYYVDQGWYHVDQGWYHVDQ